MWEDFNKIDAANDMTEVERIQADIIRALEEAEKNNAPAPDIAPITAQSPDTMLITAQSPDAVPITDQSPDAVLFTAQSPGTSPITAQSPITAKSPDATQLPDTALLKTSPPTLQPGFMQAASVKPTTKHRKPGISWVRRLVLVCIVCTLGTASFGFAFGAATAWIAERSQEASPSPPAVTQSDDTNRVVGSTRYAFETLPENAVATLADMIDLVAPSVVGLTTITDWETLPGTRFPPPQQRNGTGVIFAETEERVYILTSHYVVERGTQVFVHFSCGVTVLAEPFASDQDLNISIIAVRSNNLYNAGITNIVLATFGDSSAMRMGDTVIAMGNARGEGISVTRGVISTEEQITPVRSHTLIRDLALYTLQTDASINYGDSGGPLLNARGEVVGIIDASTNLFGPQTQAEGIGLSLASNMLQKPLYRLVNRLRPAIGIMGDTLTEARANELGIPPAGVRIDSVIRNGAAQNAGMQSEDIITGFNGQPVMNMDQLRADIAELSPGDVVEVRIFRDGAAIVLEMELFPMEFDRF